MGHKWLHLIPVACRQMRRYQLRSTLIILCAALGVSGAVTAVNYASGGRAQVLEQIRRLGTNIIVISAKQSRAVADRARTGTVVTTLSEADYRALKQELPDRVHSSALVEAALRLKSGYLSKVSPVVGVEPDYFPMKAWALKTGRIFNPDDMRRSARVALVGHSLVADLFESQDPIGQRLFINRVPFEVIGVLEERGPGLDQTNEDTRVYVPLTSAMRRLLNIDYFNSLLFEIPDVAAMAQTEQLVTQLLNTRHRISAYRPADFQVQSQRELIDTQIAAADRLGFLVNWIGLSALVVSGLGIFAIAWIAVRDRTVEIGTRRALGATAGDIFFQFAFEATVLATIGVLTGLAIGWWSSRIVAERAELVFVFDSANAAIALSVALTLNIIFACWPALRAARMNPIQALRHE